jgi:hypothetical protein
VKKRAARKNAFHEILSTLSPETTVTLLGEVSRTWYVDRNRLVEVIMALEEVGAEISIIGDGPFQHAALCAVEAAYADQAVHEVVGPEEEVVPVLICMAQLFVVFPSRVKPDILSVSPHMAAVLDAGVPVVALHPEGDSTYVTRE